MRGCERKRKSKKIDIQRERDFKSNLKIVEKSFE